MSLPPQWTTANPHLPGGTPVPLGRPLGLWVQLSLWPSPTPMCTCSQSPLLLKLDESQLWKRLLSIQILFRCRIYQAYVKVKMKLLSRVRLFATPWTVAYQASLSMGFSRQGYWSGLLFPSPGDLPDPGIEPRFPALQADALPSEPPEKLIVGI